MIAKSIDALISLYFQVPKLKEPRQLFALNNPALGPQQLARWPGELEVAVEGIKHLHSPPNFTEPFYTKSKVYFCHSINYGFLRVSMLTTLFYDCIDLKTLFKFCTHFL